MNIQAPADTAAPQAAVLGVWPDNWLPLQVFRRMLTQWCVGMSGVVGLRYEALGEVRKACGVPDEAYGELLDCIQVMERKAVDLLNTRSD